MILSLAEDLTAPSVVFDSELLATPDSGMYLNNGVHPSITANNLLQFLPNEVFVLDLHANSILNANPSALENLGYSQQELRAKHIWDIAQLAPGYALPELIRSLTDSQQTDVNLSLKRKNGTSYTVSGVLFSANDSKPNGAVARKIQCQFTSDTMYPPRMGAIPPALATMTVLMPIPRPSCLVG